MSNQDKTNVIEHITYPFTPITKEIFFIEKIAHLKDVFKNDKKIVTQQLSDELASFLETKGFVVKRTHQIQLTGRRMVYGVKITVSTLRIGYEIKEIMITINANNHEELIEKKKTLISGVRSITNVKCKTSTSDKFVRC